jgi:DNA polymerase-3 subunit alpha
MAFIQLEDLFGSVEVIVFPNVYEKTWDNIKEDKIIVVNGKLNFKEEEVPKIIAEKIISIEDYDNVEKEFKNNNWKQKEWSKENKYQGKNSNPAIPAINDEIQNSEHILIEIPEDAIEGLALIKIKDVLARFKGETPVIIFSKSSQKKYKTTRELWVNPTVDFYDELDLILDELQ